MINVKELKIKYITDRSGRKKEVILPLKEFENLIEDLEDLAVVAERREEKTVPHEDLINELKSNGIL